MEKDEKKYIQVVCPDCGYRMPVFYGEEAYSKGVRIACKGRKCRHIFELKIEGGQQIK